MRGLYVHIPFCKKICTYCDFCKRIAKNQEMIWDYLKTLKAEFDSLVEKSFTTIYIGGGTPSVLTVEQLTYLLNIFKNETPVEYTIEVNPESYTKEKGNLFKKYKVNRISLGVQTFNETILKKLNRIHSNEEVYQTIDHLNEIGITNISLDLIFALPSQTIDDVVKDLEIIKNLNVTHISYYSLILEENTILYHNYLKGLFTPTNMDIQATMFKTIIKMLKHYGYLHYEVSNFAKAKNFESIHNILYWTLKPYEAIGAGAFGFSNNYRYYHTRNITNYTNNPIKCLEKQSLTNNYQDALIFGLRMLQGINLTTIKNEFNRDPLKDFPKLNKFINNNLLIKESDIIKVTSKGLFLLNQIVEVFI